MSGLATLCNEKAPPELDIIGSSRALIEHEPHSVQEPVMQFNAATRIADGLDTEADCGESDGADEQVGEPLTRKEAAVPRTT